jgi:predicted amidohydrolase
MEASPDLHLVLVQFNIAWRQPEVNRETCYRLIRRNTTKADLILLPEMFTTGFCTDPVGISESMNGPTIRWMQDLASEMHAAVAGSLIIGENGRFFNRLVHVTPEGTISCYNKRHLFRMSGEEAQFTAGTSQLVIPCNQWRVSYQICYDLRFPVWSRNQNTYDLLVYAANWPAPRDEVWETLLRARAIENQCYVAGVNRIGTDGNGIPYSGGSKIIDPKGKEIAALDTPAEGLICAAISLTEQNRFREKFPVWKDADEFEIQN